MATDRTFDSEKVLVSHYETVNKLKKENSILSRRVAELTQELKQFSAIKENILRKLVDDKLISVNTTNPD